MTFEPNVVDEIERSSIVELPTPYSRTQTPELGSQESLEPRCNVVMEYIVDRM